MKFLIIINIFFIFLIPSKSIACAIMETISPERLASFPIYLSINTIRKEQIFFDVYIRKVGDAKGAEFVELEVMNNKKEMKLKVVLKNQADNKQDYAKYLIKLEKSITESLILNVNGLRSEQEVIQEIKSGEIVTTTLLHSTSYQYKISFNDLIQSIMNDRHFYEDSETEKKKKLENFFSHSYTSTLNKKPRVRREF